MTTAPGFPGAVVMLGQSLTTAFSTSTLAADLAGPMAASTPATPATTFDEPCTDRRLLTKRLSEEPLYVYDRTD